MKNALALVFIVVPGFAISQEVVKLYYDRQWKLTTKDSAKYFRVCGFDTAAQSFHYRVSDFYRGGKPQMMGTYLRDQRSGEFTFYYENGQVEAKGTYLLDRRLADWKFYYPDGRLNSELTVEPEEHRNKFINTEAFAAAKGVGFDEYPFLKKIRHDDEVLTRPFVFTGNPATSEVFTIVDTPANASGGSAAMHQYISKNLKYPPDARKARVSGMVHVQFIVNVDGSITGVAAVKDIGGGLSEEAVRVVRQYAMTNKWKPAIHQGEFVRQRVTFPITFKLD